MSDNICIKIGKAMLAAALIGLGALHLITRHFTSSIFPVSPSFMGGTLPACVIGCLLIIAGVLVFTKKQVLAGALLTALIFLAFLLVLHLPKLLRDEGMPGERTSASENVLLLGGALMLAGVALTSGRRQKLGDRLFITGEYLFAIALFVFGVLHFVSEAFVVSIIPKWIPWKEFWAYFVMTCFFAAAISIFIQRLVRLSSLLVSLMFFLFICLMHIPLVLALTDQEPQWTFLFVPIGLSGIALILAGSFREKKIKGAFA